MSSSQFTVATRDITEASAARLDTGRRTGLRCDHDDDSGKAALAAGWLACLL